MANRRLEYVVGLSADTTQLQLALSSALASLRALGQKPLIVSNLLEASLAALELLKHLSNAVNTDTGKLDLKTFNDSLTKSGKTLSLYATLLSSLGPEGLEAFLLVANAITKTELPLKRANKLLNELWITMKNTMRWQLTSSMLHGFVGSILTAYGYSKDLNESLNNIRIVTSKSTEDMSNFAKLANKAAKELNTLTTRYTDASLIYYQLGLSDTEVTERTETTIKLANVSRQAAEDVSDQMTAIWNNFDDGSKSLEYYADVITALGATTASSSQEIAGGLEKFAAAAETTGLSYEYSAAALATIVAATRQGEDTVGTGLRTILGRLESLLMGETLEDGVTLTKYTKALEAAGVSVLNTNGELKKADEILDSIAEKWQTMTATLQQSLAYTVGGVRQYTTLLALFNNWDKMTENVATARGAEGTLLQQADIYAESWEAARNRVRAAAEDIYDSLINPDFYIGVDNVISPILKGTANVIDAMGGMQGVLAVLATLMNKVYGDKIAQSMRDAATSLGFMTKQEQERARAILQEAVDLAANIAIEKMGVEGPLRQILELREEELKLLGKINAEFDKLSIKQQELVKADLAHILTLKAQSEEFARLIELAEEAANVYKQLIKDNINVDDKKSINTYLGGLKGNAISNKDMVRANITDDLMKLVSNSKSADLAISRLITRLEGVSLTRISVSSMVNEWERLTRDVESLTPEILEAGRALAGLSKDATQTEIVEYFELLKEKLGALDSQSLVIKATLLHFLPEDLINIVERFVANLQHGYSATEAFERAVEESKNAVDGMSNSLANGSYKVKDWAEVLVQVGSTISTLSMGVNALNSLFDVFENKDLDAGERFIGFLTSLGMLIGVIGPLFKMAKDSLNMFTAAEGAAAIGATGLGAAIGAALPIITGAVLAIVAVVKIIDVFTVSQKEAAEAIKLANEAYEEEKAKLDELNDSLETTIDRIKELESLDSLTIVEEEELNKLKTLVGLLERQVTAQEKIAEINRLKLVQTIIENTEKANSWTTDVSFDGKKKLKTVYSSTGYMGSDLTTNKLLSVEEFKEEYEAGNIKFTTEKEFWDEYNEWIAENEQAISDLISEHSEDILNAESNYLLLLEEFNKGTGLVSREQLDEQKRQLTKVRSIVFDSAEYYNNFILPIVDEIPGLMSGAINGDISDFKNELLQLLDEYGITAILFVINILKRIEGLKTNLLNVGLTESDIANFLETLSGEELELAFLVQVTEGDSFKDWYKKLLNIKSEKLISLQVLLETAKTTAKDALNLIIEGKGLDDETVKNLKELFANIFPDIADIESFSAWDQADLLLEALITLTDKGTLEDLKGLNKEVLNYRKEILEAARDTKKYGNITVGLNSGRGVKWYDDESYATVLGSFGEFGNLRIPIAFSPLLLIPGEEPLELDLNTVNAYLDKIVEEANGDPDRIIELDINGFEGFTADGYLVKGLIAAVGDEAEKVSEIMHEIDAEWDPNLGDLNTDKINAELEAIQEKFTEINNFKFDDKKIEIELDEAFLMGQTAKLSAFLKAMSAVDSSYKVTADGLDTIAKAMPLLLANAEVLATGEILLLKNVIEEYKADLIDAKNAQGYTYAEMLEARVDKAQREYGIMDLEYKDFSANENKKITATGEALRAIVKNVLLAKILKIGAYKTETETLIDSLNQMADASADNASKAAFNWMQAAAKTANSWRDAAISSIRSQNAIDNKNENEVGETISPGSLETAIGTHKGNSVFVDNSREIAAKANYDAVSAYAQGGEVWANYVATHGGANASIGWGSNAYTNLQSLLGELGYTISGFNASISSIENIDKTIANLFTLADIKTGQNFALEELKEALQQDSNYQKWLYDTEHPGKSKSGSVQLLSKKDRTEDFKEHYHEINEELEYQERLLDKIDTALDRTYGTEKLDIYDKKLEELNKKLELLLLKQDEALSGLARNREKLLEQFTDANIDPITGNLDNYTELMIRITLERQKVDDKYEAARLAGDTRKDFWEELIKNAEKAFKDAKEVIDNYEKSVEEANDIHKELNENARAIEDLKLEKLSYKFELILDIKNAKDLVTSLAKTISESFGDALTHSVSVGNLNLSLAIRDSEYAYDLMDKYAELQLLLAEATSATDFKVLNEAYLDLQGEIVSTAESLIEFCENLESVVPDAVSAASERFSQFTNLLSHNTSILDSLKELYELQGITYKTLQGFDALTKVALTKMDTALASAKLNRAEFETMEGLLKLAQVDLDSLGGDENNPRYDLYKQRRDAYLDEYNTLQEAMYSSAAEAMQALADMYSLSLERARDIYDKAVSGGLGLDYMQDKFDRYINGELQYLDKVNEAYQVASWYNKLQADIDDSTNAAYKNRLKALKDEIDARKEGNTLSEYDLDILEAKYNLLQAEMALEDARNAKSEMRLVRDRQGNWNYQFIANPDEIAKAELGVLDALNEYYNIAKNLTKDLANEIILTKKDFGDAITDLYNDTTLTTEERNAKIVEIQAYYNQRMKYLYDEMGVAVDDMTLAGIESMGEFENSYAEDLENMTGSMDEWQYASLELLDLSEADWNNYKSTMDVVAKETGTDMDTLKEKTQDVANATENVYKQGDIAVEHISNQLHTIDEAATYWGNYAEKVMKTVEALQEYNTLTANLIRANSGIITNEDIDYSAQIAKIFSQGGDVSSLLSQRLEKLKTLPGNNYKTNEELMALLERLDTINETTADRAWFNYALSIAGFDTGGYTGEFSDAKLAFLHLKELVLNQEDTANILTAVSAIRSIGPGLFEQIEKVLDGNAIAAMALMGLNIGSILVTAAGPGTLEQLVRIEHVEFPNATSGDEIKEALVGLVNDAALWAQRKTE